MKYTAVFVLFAALAGSVSALPATSAHGLVARQACHACPAGDTAPGCCKLDRREPEPQSCHACPAGDEDPSCCKLSKRQACHLCPTGDEAPGCCKE